MSANTESWPGRIGLMVGHTAGMIDLVALPVWVGALISEYKFDEPHAGGLVTLYLVGAVVGSVFFASRLNRIVGRLAATVGFLCAAVAFFAASRTADWGTLAALHAVGGAAAGCGLSFTHGTIGRSAKPHQLFALVNFALGVFAIPFLGVTPVLISKFGGPALFLVFTGVMVFATLVVAILFPSAPARREVRTEPLSRSVWFGVVAVSCMALTQAMIFSFLERIGMDRGFGRETVTGVLIALGFVALLPAPLAAFLETRVASRIVFVLGPALQALVAATIALGVGFPLYAAAALVFAPVMIFTHTFAFGVLSRLDPSSRSVAGTPAMLMIGGAIGPILGGVLVSVFGYGSLAVAAIVIDAAALILFWQVTAPARVAAAA